MYCTRKVLDDLIWVGADDRRLVCFEGAYDVPNGVSYNSYLLTDEKTVLFDTVDKAVFGQFFENIDHALGGRGLDYIVVSHMEPDHAATLELLAAPPGDARDMQRQDKDNDSAVLPRRRFQRADGHRQGGRHLQGRPPRADLCHGTDGALAGGHDDLRPDG